MRLGTKVGARTLAMGVQGQEVAVLQERLHNLGYHPGPIDSRFGYLTHDAVIAFQRDFGLKTDGLVGPRVRGLLSQPSLLGRWRTYVLGAGESLSDAARHFGVTTEALKHMNRLAPRARGYPGQRLVCRSHYIVGSLLPENRSLRTAQRLTTQLSAVAMPMATIVGGQLEIQSPMDGLQELVHQTGLPLWMTVVPVTRLAGATNSQVDVALFLSRKRLRKAAAQELTALSMRMKAGIWLDLGRPRWGDGPSLVHFTRMLRDELTPQGRPLMLTLPLPEGEARWRWWLTDIDYKELCRLADRVVLGSHLPAGLDSYEAVKHRLQAVLGMVPSWKALLGIALRAEERDGRGHLLSEIGYHRAITQAYQAGVRPKWDVTRRMMRAPLTAKTPIPTQEDTTKEPDRVLWLPGRDAVLERLTWVHRLNLGGVVFWPLGDEDTRVWDAVPRQLAPEHSGT